MKTLAISAICLSLLSCSGNWKIIGGNQPLQDMRQGHKIHQHTYETDDKFYPNEILLPDSVHSDTLIVIPDKYIWLNAMIQSPDLESWDDIKTALKLTTKPKNHDTVRREK